MGVNKVNGQIGKRGSGKTTLVRKMIEEYRRMKPEMKTLIVDTLDHPAYKDVPVITVDELARWKHGNAMYRIFGSNTDEILSCIMEHPKNILIVFEDATKYIPHNRPLDKAIRTFIIDSKQKNMDLHFMFHGFRYICPELCGLLDRMILQKTKDKPDDRKNNLLDYDDIQASYRSLLEDPDKYAYRTLIFD